MEGRHTTISKLASPRVGAALLALFVMQARSEAAPQCNDWNPVPTPNVGNSVTRLTGVTALSGNDAWAVGLWRDDPSPFGALAMRWDGTSWTEIGLPGTSHLGWDPEIDGVESASNGDVWLVGKVSTPYPTNLLPLVIRWRGGSFDFVDTVTLRPQTVYPFAARGGTLAEVAALAPDDIWAVGQGGGFGDASSSTTPVAVHWDGSSWTEVDVPLVANRHHELTDVVAIASDDVWAVGDYRNVAGTFRAVTYHWNGTAWSYVHNPIEDIFQSGLSDIVATGPSDVWAIGGADSAGVLLMHWDGTQWSLMPPPPDSGGSLAAVGPNDLWASGWNGFWHWDGSAWTGFPASVPGASYVIRSGGMEIVGGCDIWSVGFWTLADGITSFTLAERLQPGATGFCFGDGSGTGCPCGNNGASGNGCAHSLSATGANLASTGRASLANDSLVLSGTSMPNSSALYFQGTSTVNGGLGVVFGDGLRCAGGAIVRLGTQSNAGGSSQYPAAGDPPVSVRGLVSLPGTRTYQVWYRNAASFCTAATFNLTNGLSVSWEP
jgi:hypothetical protein